MGAITFAVKTFALSPWLLCTYGTLLLSILSCWVYKRIWLWPSLLLISIIFAFVSKVIDSRALLPIVILALCHIGLHSNVRGLLRMMCISIAGVISFGLMLHWLPGFNNWLIVKDIQLSPDSYPFTMYFNFDIPFIGIFVLGLNTPLLRSLSQWKHQLIPISMWIGITVVVMLLLSNAFNIVHFEPKFPDITIPWLLKNLFLVCIPAEAFWRALLQRELIKTFKAHSKWAPAYVIGGLAAAFAILHIFFVPHFSYLIMAFVSSILYGSAYYFTKSIEAAILSHFFLNVTQFFLFTYPALS